MVITKHWINNEFVLKEADLYFSQLPASHTGENRKGVVMDAMMVFDIAQKILCYTADGAANRKTCFEHLQPALKAERIKAGRGSDSEC